VNTFEAIGILKEYTGYKGDKWEVSMTAEDIKEFDEIVYLLQRGEAFEKMWERIKRDLLNASVNNWGITADKVITEIKKAEQKYFPKELPDEKTTKL